MSLTGPVETNVSDSGHQPYLFVARVRGLKPDMKRLSLRVDTLACEADEHVVLDDLLAHDGVIAAEIDLTQETLAVSYDEQRTTKTALLDHLRFFGLVARQLPPIAS